MQGLRFHHIHQQRRGLGGCEAGITETHCSLRHQSLLQLNCLEIVKGQPALRVNISVPNNSRLFVGNIPKAMTRTDIIREFDPFAGKLSSNFCKALSLIIKVSILLAGLEDVIIYSSPDSRDNNRGFCFLQYQSYKAASMAKRFALLLS